MIDEAYDQGVRAICFTPHWYPVSFGNNSEKALAAFDLAKAISWRKKSKCTFFSGTNSDIRTARLIGCVTVRAGDSTGQDLFSSISAQASVART